MMETFKIRIGVLPGKIDYLEVSDLTTIDGAIRTKFGAFTIHGKHIRFNDNAALSNPPPNYIPKDMQVVLNGDMTLDISQILKPGDTVLVCYRVLGNNDPTRMKERVLILKLSGHMDAGNIKNIKENIDDALGNCPFSMKTEWEEKDV